jgi:hypothetical protein
VLARVDNFVTRGLCGKFCGYIFSENTPVIMVRRHSHVFDARLRICFLWVGGWACFLRRLGRAFLDRKSD